MNRSESIAAVRMLRKMRFNKMKLYRPYPKQIEFHSNGAKFKERALLASNQSGKTWAAAMEVAMHATGLYPDWWEGRRFDGPTRGWVAGTSSEGTRDTVQRLLLGGSTPEEHGTGAIPRSCIVEIKQARSVMGAVGQMYIKHKSGGTSYIGVRTYEQPVERWAGESLSYVWYDEEPPIAHYSEGLTRTNARQGIVMSTLTPLLGMTQMVKMFYPYPDTNDRALTMMTLDDVDHYTELEKEKIIASYQEYEREARTMGIPMMGSGRVFPVSMASITVDSFPIPRHWSLLNGIDFGWAHPTGCVSMAWDKDSETIYITDAYRVSKRVPNQIVPIVNKWNDNLTPWAWPHDGGVEHDRGSGQTIAQQYRREGLKMLPEHCTFEDGGHSFEAGIVEMLQLMESGKFKVFRHLQEWFGEFNIYHRKDGKVVKEDDDLLSATRMVVMGKRFARVRTAERRFSSSTSQEYDPFARAM